MNDAVSLFFAVIAALGLAFGFSELIMFAIAIGSTIWDIIDALNK